jgi:hypothetical protein
MTMSGWIRMPPPFGIANAEVVDPYLRIADATDFCDHRENPHRGDRVTIAVQRLSDNPAAIEGLRIPWDFFTTRVASETLARMLESPEFRIVLASAIRPQRPGPPVAERWAGLPRQPKMGRVQPRSKLLLGVVDSGCPFAHRDLRRTNEEGHEGTRVVAIWDQQARPGFDDGTEITGDQLDELMQKHRLPDGRIDENALYRSIAYEPVLRRLSHGAMVAAGRACLRRQRHSATTPRRPTSRSSSWRRMCWMPALPARCPRTASTAWLTCTSMHMSRATSGWSSRSPTRPGPARTTAAAGSRRVSTR